MPNPQTTGTDRGFIATRLERAAKRVEDHWFPSNPELIVKIQRGIADGNFELDIEFLLSEIKTDFSLFSFCIRETLAMLKREKCEIPDNANPFEILRTAGLPRIRKVIDKCESRISSHGIVGSSQVQLVRFKEAMISASAAETLAPFFEIESEVGFSAALIKQLGLALIAWNYPSVYQRACERSDVALSLEQAINDALGFSPAMLGSYLLGRWGASNELRSVVAHDPTVSSGGMSETQLYLKKICDVGEALARADNPQYYPNAESDWNSARATVESILGAEGMQKIQEHVRKNCESYRVFMPQEFASTELFNPGSRISLQREEKLFDRNPFVKNCAPNIKREFRELYSAMHPKVISQHSVRALMQTIIPMAGFTGGCVFVIDPASGSFVPRLTTGTIVLRQLRRLSFSDYSSKNDSVVSAFECQIPLIEHAKSELGETLGSIAASVGDKQRLGVLYLELPQSSLDDMHLNMVGTFKAMRKALQDALYLF